MDNTLKINLTNIQHRLIELDAPMVRSMVEVQVVDGVEVTEEPKYVFRGSAITLDRWSNDLGGFKEIIHSGALNKTIFSRCIATFNHREELFLGKVKSGTLRLNKTDKGVDVEIDDADTTISRNCREWVMRGDIDGMSFKFFIADNGSELTYNESTRIYEHHIHDIQEVLDVSLVVRQSYEDTNIGISRQIELDKNAEFLKELQRKSSEEATKSRVAWERAINRVNK